MLRRAKETWERVRQAAGLVFRIHDRLTHIHARLTELAGVLGRMQEDAHRRGEDGAPVSVQLFGQAAKWKPWTEADDRIEAEPLRTEVVASAAAVMSAGWTVSAKTIWLKRGERAIVSFMPQRPIEPGAWVFVTGPALMTSLLVGQDSQTVFAPSQGAVGRLTDGVQLGNSITVYLEWADAETLARYAR